MQLYILLNTFILVVTLFSVVLSFLYFRRKYHSLVSKYNAFSDLSKKQLSLLEKQQNLLEKHRKDASRHEWIQEEKLSLIIRHTRRLSLPRISLLTKPSETSPRALFVSSNGGGLGHLTRLLAISRAWQGEYSFITLSEAYPLIFTGEQTNIKYCPSPVHSGLSRRLWSKFFYNLIATEIESLRPDIVIFDGAEVYLELVDVCDSYGVPLVWSRRGCWKTERQESSEQFKHPEYVADALLIPGDYGCDEPEINNSIPTLSTAPITLVSRDALYERAEACQKLGLDADKRYVLIQLGGGVINDKTSAEETAIEAVKNLGADWIPVLVVSPLKGKSVDREDVVRISAYPLAHYYRAFEFSVIAGGYNSFQEVVSLNAPAIVVPNEHTVTDDQVCRAQVGDEKGLVLCAQDSEQLTAAIQKLADPAARAEIIQNQQAQPDPTGAQESASWLMESLTNQRLLIKKIITE